MNSLIEVPARPVVGNSASNLQEIFDFSNEDMKDSLYIQLAPEIPRALLNLQPPPKCYKLAIRDGELNEREKSFLRVPTVEEALWACGWMNLGLAAEVYKTERVEGLRFPHEPFDEMQIVVKRAGVQGPYYSVETVPASTPLGLLMRCVYVLK